MSYPSFLLLAGFLGAAVDPGPVLVETPVQMVVERGCAACHAPAVPSQSLPTIAPTWKEIAARYRGHPGAEEALVKTVIGGTDHTHWKGRAALASMLPQEPWITPADAREVVRWILSGRADP